MDKAAAKTLTDDYIANGDDTHFDFEGNRIKGYVFTRAELSPLLGNPVTKHLFLMLGLSTDSANPPAKYLNLIVAGITKNTNLIDESSFLVTSSPVVTFPAVQLAEVAHHLKSSETISEVKKNEQKIPRIVFENGHSEFILYGNNAHLYTNTNLTTKIKGYHFGDVHDGDIDESTYLQDLRDLGLINPPAGAQPTDQFIFMPIIRKNNPDPTVLAKPYLSIAVSRYINGSISGKIYEYCLPCPSACPNNFPLQ